MLFVFVLLLVDTFRTLSSLSSPLDKLQCVVSVAKAICACVDQAKQAQIKHQQLQQANESELTAGASNTQNSPVVIGADDLLLLFTYLLIHTSVPNLLAELSFLSDFIPEHQRCTMQGYYLATTQAAAELLMSEDFHATIQRREGGSGGHGGEDKQVERVETDTNQTKQGATANTLMTTDATEQTSHIDANSESIVS